MYGKQCGKKNTCKESHTTQEKEDEGEEEPKRNQGEGEKIGMRMKEAHKI